MVFLGGLLSTAQSYPSLSQSNPGTNSSGPGSGTSTVQGLGQALAMSLASTSSDSEQVNARRFFELLRNSLNLKHFIPGASFVFEGFP